jgi:hypothetical protein
MFKHALSTNEINALYTAGNPPVITSFTPVTGTIGTTVTITGTGFSTTPASNIVYFGAVKATVSASTTTSITVTVPAGAGSVVPVTVTVDGAVAFSTTCSTPTFTLTNSPNLSQIYQKTDVAAGGTGPISVAVGDFNGDGNADMATVNTSSNSISVLLGTGTGSYSAAVNYPVGTFPISVAVGDFNGDGNLDLATANINSNNVSVLLGSGDGTFGIQATYSTGDGPRSVAVGDFNRDGKADLTVANSYANNVSVLLGNGTGGFAAAATFTTGTGPISVTVGDFNADGKADMATANYNTNNVSVLLGNGIGGFATAVNYTVGTQPTSIAVGDLNGDGKNDLAVSNKTSSNVSVLLGNGTGTFAAAISFPVGFIPYAVVIGDFNGDGKTDLATSNVLANDISILLGNGVGGFAAAINLPVGSEPYSMAVSDFNGDGKADLVAANLASNTISILLNATIGITTQASTDIGSFTATGNGNLLDLGLINPTAYGVCWNTTGTPTISDNKVDLGAASAAGPFTALMTGLEPNTLYYVRAYATTTSGTYYGDTQSFTTVPFKIISFSPASGPAGTTITITGTGFSATPANNIVYFGAVKATVSASTTTSITVTVPAGAGSVVPVAVTLFGRTAYSVTSSTPSFTLTNTPNLSLVYQSITVALGVNNSLSVSNSDFNADGKVDLVIANSGSNNVSVLLGIGGGIFETAVNYPVSTAPCAVSIGDFNGDGIMDLATANYSSNNVSILQGSGDGTFGSAVQYAAGTQPKSLTSGDFNMDGKPDLAIANNGSNNVSVLLGDGIGGFAAAVNYAVGSWPKSIQVGDFNRDGKADLATANYWTNNMSVLLGNGTGGFAAAVNYTTGSHPQSVTVGDFNADGKPDLATANMGSNNVSVFIGNGTGGFATSVNYPTGSGPNSIAIGDFNGDGKTDLATTNYFPNTISNLLGNGLGGFAAAVNTPLGNYPQSVSIGDLNGDGKADMVTANEGTNNISVLLNGKLTITTQAVSGIGPNSATGNGNVVDLGSFNVTAHGFCWNTTGTPTISDNKVDLGSGSVTGPFTALMTGLGPNTLYFVRAYASCPAGTSYGDQVTFTSLQSPIKITSMAPISGPIGTTVVLTGFGFSTTPSENTVYFGAIKATVSASTSTSITVTVPAGAGSIVPVSVTMDGHIAYSSTSLTPSFTLTNTPNIGQVYQKTDFNNENTAVSIVIGDFNSDGKADLATVNQWANNIGIMLGLGSGNFATVVNYPVGLNPTSFASGDFNGDGHLDLVSANYTSSDASVLLGLGDGTFGPSIYIPSGTGSFSMVVGDFNGDGKADLAFANDNSDNISVLLGNGNGTFSPQVNYPTGSVPKSIAIGDFNGDGKADMVTANKISENVSVLIGNGDGSFAPAVNYPVGMVPYAITVGDFNGDGNADLATANIGSGNLSILLGTGIGTFTASATSPAVSNPFALTIGDFNGDGNTDLATANWSSNILSVLLGDGNGGFASPVNLQANGYPHAIVAGDLNGDGRADIVSASYYSTNVSIWLNATAGITTQAVTGIHETSATGTGYILDLGVPNPTAYGVCWNTTGAPTVMDSKTDNGVPSSTGLFTSTMTDLVPNTMYYVRAYITSPTNTRYGDVVSFTTLPVNIWTGASSTDWNTANNWSSGSIPVNSIGVIIPAGVPNWPTFSGNFTIGNQCGNLSIQSGAQMTITGNLNVDPNFILTNNGFLNIGGNWLCQGTHIPGTGTVEFVGTGISSVDNPSEAYLINDDFTTWPGNWLGDIGFDYGYFQQHSSNTTGGVSPEVRFLYGYSSETKRLYQIVNTTGLSALTLQFKQYVDHYSSGYSVKIEYSTDGTNWNEAGWSLSPTDDVPAQTVNVNLNSGQGVGSDTYYIAFTITGDLLAINYWYIDDVTLTYNCSSQNDEFNNLMINKAMPSGGVNLNDNVTVNGNLTLTSGLLNLGSNNLLLGANTLIAGTPSDTNMVVATGSGELRKAFAAPGSFTFPVGDDIGTPEYSPVSLDFTTGTFGTDAYAAVRLVNAPLNGTTTNYLNRYWNVAATGINSFTCNANFNYLAEDVTGNEAGLMCVQSLPPDLTVHGAANTILHQLTATGISSFGAFTGEGNSSNKTVTLSSVFPEGLYDGGGVLRQAQNETGAQWPAGVADHITVELHDAADYATIVYSAPDVELTTSGSATLNVPATFSGSYYVTVKHRNSIQITSADPVTFTGNTIAKSYSTPADVFGGNLLQMSDLSYAIYAGDINQDGVVDGLDMIPLDNLSAAFGTGYLPEDLNGDGSIDALDMILLDNNSAAFISAILP